MSAPEAERAPSPLPCTALPISARAPETAAEEIPIAAFLLVDQVMCLAQTFGGRFLEYSVMHGRFSEYKVLDRPLYAYCGIRDACRRPGGSIADALNVRGLVGQLEPLEQPTADLDLEPGKNMPYEWRDKRWPHSVDELASVTSQ